MRLEAIGRFFEKLGEGDWIAWGFVLLALTFVVFVVLVAWRSRRENRRYEEEQRKKRGYPPIDPKQLTARGRQ